MQALENFKITNGRSYLHELEDLLPKPTSQYSTIPRKTNKYSEIFIAI
jgi:hypothetical protein